MRWRPRPIQPCLDEAFQPVYTPDPPKPSRFYPKPAARITAERIAALPALSEAELAMRAQIREDQAAQTAAHLEELRVLWETKKRRMGL